MSRGHVSGNLQAGVQPLQAFPSGQSLTGYAEHVYEQPEGEPPVETNSIRYWRDWAGLRNGQLELRLNNQRAPRVHGLGWGLDPDAGVWRPLRVDATGALVVAGSGPTPELNPPTAQLSAWYRAGDILQGGGTTVFSWADRSGNGAGLVPVPGIAQPTLATNVAGFGGQSAVQFSGTQQLGRLLPPGFFGGDSAFSLYVVHSPAATGDLTVFSWGQYPAASGLVTLFFSTVAGNRKFTVTDLVATGAGYYAATSVPQIDSAFLAHGGNISNATIWRDGAAPSGPDAPGGGPLNLATPVAEVRMGGIAGSAIYPYVGQIAEVLVYHKNHNATERSQTLAYLSARYGIPVV